jgi:hypothetical protein
LNINDIPNVFFFFLEQIKVINIPENKNFVIFASAIQKRTCSLIG